MNDEVVTPAEFPTEVCQLELRVGNAANEHISKIRICLIHPPAHSNIRIYSNMGALVCTGLQNDPYRSKIS